MASPGVALFNVIRRNMSWEDYESALSSRSGGLRIFYSNGNLEIMTVSATHEFWNRTLSKIVETLAEETGKDLAPLGSTTFKREKLQKGFEPDSAFYFEHAQAFRAKEFVGSAVDPAPELIIEVDITSQSIDRFPIYAAFGVKEIWRYDGRLRFYRLVAGSYEEIDSSDVFPVTTAQAVQGQLQASQSAAFGDWMRDLRKWARGQRPS
ncbi:MAG: Uma2 family endonuclease [Bryobacteraceae bacterium]